MARVDRPRTEPEPGAARKSPGLAADPQGERTAILDREEVARLAYEYWMEGGRREGAAEDDWYRAEQELRSRTQRHARGA